MIGLDKTKKRLATSTFYKIVCDCNISFVNIIENEKSINNYFKTI